ncbi:response regulator transcription factor [Vibrio mytili]|uniref:response regulator transcription factor n=1 Tax=Vibrio mytili TaxID=50718 RepID=UPI002F3EE5D2
MELSTQYFDVHLLTRDNSYSRVIRDLLKVTFPYIKLSCHEHFPQISENEAITIILFDVKTMPSPQNYGILPNKRKEKWIAVNVHSQTSLEWLEKGYSGQISHGLELLPKAVHAVVNGDIWFPRSILNKAIHHYQQGSENPAVLVEALSSRFLLTRKESEICKLMLQGLSNTQIARHSNVSINTVKTHASNVLHKLEIRSRYELMAMAREQV